MNRFSLGRLLGALLLAGACSGASAIPVMDMRAEDLVPMAGEFRHELTLTPNQQTLWQRVEERSRALLRERQGRRQRLQASLQAALNGAKVELRELDGAIASETAATAAEDRQLRAMWLEVNDALDDGQRQQVAAMIGSQLQRVAGGERHEAPRADDKGQKRGGGRRGGMGGGGGIGMGGGGMGGGAN